MTEITTKKQPIFFDTVAVRSILKGRKTQTRRIIRPGDTECPFGKQGDTLWVRETWAVAQKWGGTPPQPLPFELDIQYRSTWKKQSAINWRAPVFMPCWISRIALEITNIRIERLHDITQDDAIAEGVEHIKGQWRNYLLEGAPPQYPSAKDSFRSLWQKINGEKSWQLNPRVWVIDFKQIV